MTMSILVLVLYLCLTWRSTNAFCGSDSRLHHCPTVKLSSIRSKHERRQHELAKTTANTSKPNGGERDAYPKDRREDAVTNNIMASSLTSTRRSAVIQMARGTTVALLGYALSPAVASARQCTDIESCREIGEQKVEEEQKRNPTTILPHGIKYKVLRGGTGADRVKQNSSLDIIYSINLASGGYMYSKGFGYEKVKVGDELQSDLGLESYRVSLGQRDVPQGIEEAMVGMKRGERRRISLPPDVGFETSGWKPQPTTRRGKAQIESYKRILTGFGSQPPFPASTIWDVEVLKIRS